VSPSIVDPIQPAIAKTKQILFEPFEMEKWLKLGFCAFLMDLASGSGGGSSGGRATFSDGSDFESMMHWINDNLTVVIVVASVVVIVAVVVGFVLTWLSSRGRFMFLDGVVNNRGAVVAPWNEYGREANSLFLFRICLGLFSLLTIAAIIGVAVFIALPDIHEQEFGGHAVGGIVAGVLLLILFGVTISVISMFLRDFVVPIMYLRRLKVIDAWAELYSSIVAGNGLILTGYFLFKLLIGIAVGTLTMGVVCLTCCIAIIPYVGSVVLLPLSVFLQAYPLYFLQQFGPEWRIFLDKEVPALSAAKPPVG
jgi:hypothetical protein